MKMSNAEQFTKAKKLYGKDFNANGGDSGQSDTGLGKDVGKSYMENAKLGRFAKGGAIRQPRDASMKFAGGGKVKPRHSDMEDAADMAADSIDAKKAGMTPAAFEKSPQDARKDKMKAKTRGFPPSKSARFATGGKVQKRAMGGMMGDGMVGTMEDGAPQAFGNEARPLTPPNTAIGGIGNVANRLRPRGLARPMGGIMAPPSPPMAPQAQPMQQMGGDGGAGFKRGGVIKRAAGGAAKVRKSVASASGAPMKASSSPKPRNTTNVI